MGAMIGKGKKERAALGRLTEFLVDDILKLSDEDVLDEFKEIYGDPDANAAELRAIFEKSVLLSNKERLAIARMGVVKNARPSALAGEATAIDMQSARARLRALIDTPGLRSKITLAARKEGELSDDDILGMLEDLRELGILPPDDESGER
jgi:hypothetical protein